MLQFQETGIPYKWYTEDIKNYGADVLIPIVSYKTGFGSFHRKDAKFSCYIGRHLVCSYLGDKGFKKIEDCVKDWFGSPPSIDYSDAVRNAKLVKKGDIVHNSNLKVEAKINLADNKLPFNEKFKKEALNALYECIETAYPAGKNKDVGLMGKNKKPKSAKKDNAGAENITQKIEILIEDYNKKCPGYTLTFSDLMSIDELRLLIQGNFEDEVLNEYIWAKDGFDEKNAKELEALIRDTFVFHDIYAVNFLLANKFVQDAFIKVNIPTEFSSNSPMFIGYYKSVDHRLRNIGRNKPYEKGTAGRFIVTNTADSMYSFNGIESLNEADLVKFLGQEFYKDYTEGLTSKFKKKFPVLPAITKLSAFNDNQLASLYVAIFNINQPNIIKLKRNKALADIEKGTKDAIRTLLKRVLEDRYKLYYGGNVHGDARMVIKGTYVGSQYRGLSPDEKQFSEAFDYLALEGETGRLAKLSDRELKLVRGRYKNPEIVAPEGIRAISTYLNSAKIRMLSQDYREVFRGIRENAFVYMDPPYMPISETSSFTGYTAAGFDRQQQTELKKQCDKLDKKGVKFMLSNSSCDFIAKLYRDYRIEHVSAPRSVNAKADGRGRVEELLIMNY